MADDTVYTVVDNLETNAGGPSGSFYERGTIYEDIQLSDSIIDEVRAEADRAEAVVAEIDADAAAALASKLAAQAAAAAALVSENNALTSKNAAATSATASAGSATTANTAATNAATSAAGAATSAGTATTQAGIATTQAGTATTQAGNAATSATAAAASLTSFKGIYYGPLAANPTLDPNGAAIGSGDFYYNTVSLELRYYNGTSWVAVVGGTGLSDEVRRNIVLSAIRDSKALAQVSQIANGVADGFGAVDGVNAGASSGYEADAPNRRVTNSVTVDVWSTAVSFSMTGNDPGWTNGDNHRCYIASSNFATMTGSKVRLTLAPPTSGLNTNISKLYFGHKGAGTINYDGTQVQNLLSGSAATALTAGGADVVTDAITYAFDSTKDFIYSIRYSATSDVRTYADTASLSFNFKTSADESSTSSVSGYSTGSTGGAVLKKIEVLTTAGGVINNIVLVGNSTTADAVPSLVRACAVIEKVDAATLGTDVTLEVTRDGGTTWTNAPLVQYHTLGTKVYVESADISVTAQPSGSSVSWRYKTFNNKRVYLHGIELNWS